MCPLGAIEIGFRPVAAGEVFEVSDELGALLLRQPANFQLADESAPEAEEATE